MFTLGPPFWASNIPAVTNTPNTLIDFQTLGLADIGDGTEVTTQYLESGVVFTNVFAVHAGTGTNDAAFPPKPPGTNNFGFVRTHGDPFSFTVQPGFNFKTVSFGYALTTTSLTVKIYSRAGGFQQYNINGNSEGWVWFIPGITKSFSGIGTDVVDRVEFNLKGFGLFALDSISLTN